MLTNARNDVTVIVNFSVYCSGYKSHLGKSICHGVDTYNAVKVIKLSIICDTMILF